jgi:DNA processing protein
MDYPIRSLSTDEYPKGLREIPQPPEKLFMRGQSLPQDAKYLAVVGSRNYSNYGKQVVEYLIEGLRGYPIAIVSGLALGIDALAHEAALRAKLYTLAVPGSGISDGVLYPRRNRALASRILEAGGGILSEFEPDFEATPWSFPQRNRIMAGLSHTVLVIEASEKSGTLITARLTVDYNRDLLVVPGNIFSENSKGPHQFLKLGATPVTSPEDILEVLHLDKIDAITAPISTASSLEEAVLVALTSPTDRDTLIRTLKLSTQEANTLLMSMELKGLIRESNGIFYKA